MATPNLTDKICDWVRGNDLTIRRTIEDIPAGQLLVSAILTVKLKPKIDSDADAVFQKTITTANSPGVGQVEDDGTGDQIGVVRFDGEPADSNLLIAGRKYHFDIKVFTDAIPPQEYTPNKGTIETVQEVTRT